MKFTTLLFLVAISVVIGTTAAHANTCVAQPTNSAVTLSRLDTLNAVEFKGVAATPFMRISASNDVLFSNGNASVSTNPSITVMGDFGVCASYEGNLLLTSNGSAISNNSFMDYCYVPKGSEFIISVKSQSPRCDFTDNCTTSIKFNGIIMK